MNESRPACRTCSPRQRQAAPAPWPHPRAALARALPTRRAPPPRRSGAFCGGGSVRHGWHFRRPGAAAALLEISAPRGTFCTTTHDARVFGPCGLLREFPVLWRSREAQNLAASPTDAFSRTPRGPLSAMAHKRAQAESDKIEHFRGCRKMALSFEAFRRQGRHFEASKQMY